MFFDFRGFYKFYKSNHFLYLLSNQMREVERIKNEQTVNSYTDSYVTDSSIEDNLHSLKALINQNSYHSIETLIMFISCLRPNDDSNIPVDHLIVENFSKRTNYLPLIRNFAESKDNVEAYFSKKIVWKENSYTYGEYLFYLGVRLVNEEMEERISSSLNSIYESVYKLSKLLSDSRLYNSYKHGMRNIPYVTYFRIEQKDNPEIKLEMDLRNTITFPDRNKHGEIKFLTETLDYEKSASITILCSRLIENIVSTRSKLCNEGEGSINSCFWNSKDVENTFKSRVETYSFKFSSESI